MKPRPRRLLAAGAWVVAGLLIGLATMRMRHEEPADTLDRRLASLAQPAAGTEVPCSRLRASRPLVVLVLGQSNAANHGQAGGSSVKVPIVSATGTCHLTDDPLPGGTGSGGSIWSHLQEAFDRTGAGRPLVLGLLAVDATRIDEWAEPDGPLARRLQATTQAMLGAGLTPDLVLWQQGEADARIATDPAHYTQALASLAERLAAQGVRAPWMVARSTRCRRPADEGLRAALQALVTRDPRFRLGPDTDSLDGPEDRHDGCHLSRQGLQQAAAQWAAVLARPLAARGPDR